MAAFSFDKGDWFLYPVRQKNASDGASAHREQRADSIMPTAISIVAAADVRINKFHVKKSRKQGIFPIVCNMSA